MSTPNFKIQKDFDMYVAIYKNPSDADIKAWENETGEQFDANFERALFYSDMIMNFNYQIEACLKKYKKDLIFFEPQLKDGYYDGIQTYIKFWQDSHFNNIDEMDNDDTHYYYNMNKSTAKRKYQSELNFINKKLLPDLKNIGFERLVCDGIFSNGEAIYSFPDRIQK